MDVDWCLACDCRIVDDYTSAYCSPECKSRDAPRVSPCGTTPFAAQPPRDELEFICNEIAAVEPVGSRWCGHGIDGIIAWARDIPPACPAGAPSHTEFNSPPSPTSKTLRPPKLLQSSHQPLPPTLCMSVPTPSRPRASLPITTPQQQIATLSLRRRKSEESSSTDSMFTESIATPSSIHHPHLLAVESPKASVFGALASHVKSWVCPPEHGQHIRPESTSTPCVQVVFPILASHDARETSSPLDIRVFKKFLPSDKETIAETPQRLTRRPTVVAFPDPSSSQRHLASHEPLSAVPLKERQPRERARQSGQGVGADHPVYRSRGRKLSRAA